MKKMPGKKIKITDVNPHLICVLCSGYYIDATTIIECLHSFCRSCIVKYLEKNKYCPICDVQIHKSTPLLNIRRDKTLQNIVYKLVPSLFKNEMQRRKEFFQTKPKNSLPKLPEDRGEVSETTPIFLPDEPLVLCLEYMANEKKDKEIPKRFLHCPASVPLSHIVKLIRGKFSLNNSHKVNIFFQTDMLSENITIMDVAYTYLCRRRDPILLYYRILELKRKIIKIMPPVDNKRQAIEKEIEEMNKLEDEKNKKDMEWKEVQLQISENGVMSVRNMANSECSPIPAVEAPSCNQQSTSPPSHPTASMTTSVPVVTSTSTKVFDTPKVTVPYLPNLNIEPIVSLSKVSKDQVKKETNCLEGKLSISRVSSAAVKGKGEVLNKIVSKLSPNERLIGNSSVSIRPLPNTPKPPPVGRPAKVERKPQQPIKYKTLTCPTKQWNPSIDRATMLTMKQNMDMTKPPRFFKLRNMPRYLGNPASGVKPMFANNEEKDTKPRSPTKLPPPYTPGSPKMMKPYDKISWPRVPSPAHSGSLMSPNPYHMMYNNFPSPYPSDSLLSTASPEMIRSMYQSAAFHQSLPPSISMLFNPLLRPPLDPLPTIQRVPKSKSPKTDAESQPSTSSKPKEKENIKIPIPPPTPSPPPSDQVKDPLALSPIKSQEKMDTDVPINNNIPKESLTPSPKVSAEKN